MKRVLALLLSCLMVCMLAGCSCSHQWEKATCEDPMTCIECGEEEGKALGHKWEEATCQAPKHCTVCDKTEGTVGEHVGDEWERRPDGNGLKEPGVLVQPCAVCGIELNNFKNSALYNANGIRNSSIYYLNVLTRICEDVRKSEDGKSVVATRTNAGGLYNLNVSGCDSVMLALYKDDEYVSSSATFDELMLSQSIMGSRQKELDNFYLMVAATIKSIDPFIHDSDEARIAYVRETFEKLINKDGFDINGNIRVQYHGVIYVFQVSGNRSAYYIIFAAVL